MREFAASAEAVRAGQIQPIEVRGPHELRTATVALNAMQERISGYIQERTTMIGAIAHDLRAPLSRLKFHVVNAPSSLRLQIEREIAEMEQLIDVTLAFVDEDTRVTSPTLVDLSSLVEAIADDFTDSGHDVKLDTMPQVTIDGDPVLLRRAFTNLIDNAIKYGGDATVSMSTSAEKAIVDIIDSGSGMAEDDLARAFEPFFRAERSRNRRTGGVGLGLAIVRTAILKHNGTVTLENHPGAGLRARVTFLRLAPGE
jgi:signal transduction histidine kinase